MNLLIKTFLLSIFLATSSLTFADWDPDFIEDADLSPLEDQSYLTLKNKILGASKGSWCSEEKVHLLMDLVVITKPKVCVEIGACTGSSVLPVAAALQYVKTGKVYAIDAWSNKIATQYWENTDPNKAWWSTVDMKAIRKSFDNLIKTWDLKQQCTTLALPSQQAVSKLPEIDFLHLDGDYSEKGSLKDVTHYVPKVKSGGYILLSNFFTMINGKQPKLASFSELLKDCEIITEIERDNAILFRKY